MNEKCVEVLEKILNARKILEDQLQKCLAGKQNKFHTLQVSCSRTHRRAAGGEPEIKPVTFI